MRKLGLQVLLIVVLFVSLVACSETTSNSPQSDGDTQSEADVTENDTTENEREQSVLDGDSSESDAETTEDGDSADNDNADLAERDKESSGEAEEAAATLGVLSIAELHEILTAGGKDFLLINVHVPNQGEIAGTDTHISYQDGAAIKAYVGQNLSAKVVVYCMSNYMSLITGKDLVAAGYTAIRYLDGGMSGWQQAGYELVNVPARKLR